jgi:GR25 family glycosyltransferase involved in LPS biosynthesis/glycosyltransferase involved in cell wall biosynthesis
LSAHADRLRIIEFSPDASRGEAPTLDLIRTFAAFHPDAHVLYLHAKGASHVQPAVSVADWRRLMLHYLVERHADARAALGTNDAVGCNLTERPYRHFSGNFWWANAAYLRTLPPVPAGERHEAEWWVLGGDGVRAASQHDSGVNHYQQRYLSSQYEKGLAKAPQPEGRMSAETCVADVGPGAGMRPSICLVMIVRNEAHIVHEALASALPYVADCVVVDTGSTDGTQDAIRRFCTGHGLPTRVFERPWRDFGSNRSEALALAREHSVSDYLWMFDADDVLEGAPEFAQLTADAGHLRLGPDIEYWRLQVFRRVLPWRFVGVLHEYPVCDVEGMRLAYVQGDYRVLSRRLGDRSRDPQKYAQDAALLEAALHTDPDNSRYTFYLGQSQYDAGQFKSALESYQRRVAMGGWGEEVFYSRYRVALCLERLGRSYAEVIAAFEACFREHPHRCEPLVRAATLARQGDHFHDAYVFARRAANVPMPGAEGLFVETADYTFRARDEQSIAAFYCGFPEESFELCSELLDARDIPEGERPRVEQNRDYSVPAERQVLAQYDANLVAELTARPPSPQPSVTLAITSCRRLDLFIATVTSFLNACTDLHLVERFICVDDNSSEADRDVMQQKFPFFEFIFKGPADRGHARSLNLLRDAVRSPWLVHLEDDWQFFARRPYIGPALEILEEDSALGQVLFNRNYAETLDDRGIPGGFVRSTRAHRYRYRVHEHYPVDTGAYRHFEARHGKPGNAWWPHYSLRPSVLRTSMFQRVGVFDESAGHFEHDYARRYLQAGFHSAFFDGVYALHTGRLTSERGDAAKANAYDLNGQPQFGAIRSAGAPLPAESLAVRVINLARRHERLDGFRARVASACGESFQRRVERFEAIDGRELALIPELRHLFRNNDFGYRRSVVACALSHLALWSDLVAKDAPGMLVLEDDAILCPGFDRRLEEFCVVLDQHAPGFDLSFLGIADWQPRPEDDFEKNHGAVAVRRFDGSRYLGGTFAYIVSRRGAQRLLALVERDGIQNGIDRFVHRKESELSLWVAAPHLVRAPLVPPGSGLDSDVQNDFEQLPQPG